MNYTYAKDRYVHSKDERLKMLDEYFPWEARSNSFAIRFAGKGSDLTLEMRPYEVYKRGPKRPAYGLGVAGLPTRQQLGKEVGHARRHRLNPLRRTVAENRAAR